MTPGQSVVCVDDKFPSMVREMFAQLPVEGVTYTIRAVVVRREHLFPTEESAVPALLLVELVNGTDPTAPNGGELAFRAERFRPLQEMETARPAAVPVKVLQPLTVPK